MKSKNWFDRLIKDKGIPYKLLQEKLGFASDRTFRALRQDPEKLTLKQMRLLADVLGIDYFDLFILICAEIEKDRFIESKRKHLILFFRKK